jgi:putative FmdB family regulatory protein
MPTYEYLCSKCGNQYEKREGFDAPARQRCPKCRGAAQRMLFAPPIVFKGSGFYVTDSRKSESGVVGDGASDKKPASDKSESKPEKTEKKETSASSSEPEAAAAG